LLPGDRPAGVFSIGRDPRVEFLFLVFRELQRFRGHGDAVPDILDKLDSLRDAQFQNVREKVFVHAHSLSVSLAGNKYFQASGHIGGIG